MVHLRQGFGVHGRLTVPIAIGRLGSPDGSGQNRLRRFESNGFLILSSSLELRYKYGRLTEWLGSGLQNRLRRFESATDLNQSQGTQCPGIFCFRPKPACRAEVRKQKIPKWRMAPLGLVDGSPRTGSPEVIRKYTDLHPGQLTGLRAEKQ
jgi:hypothetical protein